MPARGPLLTRERYQWVQHAPDFTGPPLIEALLLAMGALMLG